MPRYFPQTNSNVVNSMTSQAPPQASHTWLSIPCTNQANWGSLVLLDCKETNILIHEAIVVYNLSSITGYTGTSTYAPRLTPAFNFAQKTELVFGNNSIDTIMGVQNQINNNIWQNDENRLFINNAAGNYASQLQRYNMGQTTSTYYSPLYGIINQLAFMPLSSTHNFTIKLYLDTLVNLIEKGTLTGTGNVTINGISLLLRISKIPQQMAQMKLEKLRISNNVATYNSTVTQQFTVNSGLLQSTTILASLSNSDIQWLYFVVRPINVAITGDLIQTFQNVVSNFYIIGSDGQNITSGSPVSSSFALNTIARESTLGTYCQETAFGSVDNKCNVYMWFFNIDAVATSKDGVERGKKRFTGSESIVINYTTALAYNYQIDVFASATAIFSQSLTECKKLAIV